MTSVQNHQQQLSGNRKLKKSYITYALTILLGVTACTPRSTVLRAPGSIGQVSGTENNTAQNNTENQASEKENSAKAKKIAVERTIALLLPFQLDNISGTGVEEKDVKRSALALDFYQGFELGLRALNNKTFNLKVIDSKDNTYYNSTLASSEEIANSGIIIGPVYPIEIKAFGNNLADKNKLIVNPLAASPASEFGLNNLVTVTPSIKSHSKGIATRVASDHLTGDVIIIYQASDNDSRQFLDGMSSAVKAANPQANIVSVSTLAQLNEKLSTTGTNQIISGTTDKTNLNNLISNLSKKSSESFYSIRLYGHPLWDRFDFGTHSNFYNLRPIITAESNLKSWTNQARNFRDLYKQEFGVFPSDQSYKGYDIAQYFGKMMDKHGAENLKSKLESESYTGLYNSYKFVYNENWGFTNEAVSYKEYIHGSFQLQ